MTFTTPPGLPYLLEGVDRYTRYQAVDEASYGAFLDRQHAALMAAGRPGYFVDVVKASHGLGPVSYLGADNAQQRRLCGPRPWLVPGKYHWLTPGPDSHIAAQANLALAIMRPLGAGWFLQCDAEESGITAHMVDLFLRLVSAGLGRNQCQYGKDWTNRATFPEWRAWYHGTPTAGSAQFAASINYIVAKIGHEPVLLQWGGGVEGAFVPGLNSGLARVDSNMVFDWSRVLAAAGRGVQAPPVQTPPPVKPPGDDVEFVRLNVAGSNAIFESGGGTMRWVQTGAEVPAGSTVVVKDSPYFKARLLVGPIPAGDPAYKWTAADFLGWPTGAVGPPGPMGPQGVPGLPGLPGTDGNSAEITVGSVLTITELTPPTAS